jgi:hypothetical protein
MARGVPEEFVTIATGRLDGINEAYNAILKERRVEISLFAGDPRQFDARPCAQSNV